MGCGASTEPEAIPLVEAKLVAESSEEPAKTSFIVKQDSSEAAAETSPIVLPTCDAENEDPDGLPALQRQTSSVIVPAWARCTLTGFLLRDPIQTIYGNVYEWSAITYWLDQGQTASPVNGQPLSMADMTACSDDFLMRLAALRRTMPAAQQAEHARLVTGSSIQAEVDRIIQARARKCMAPLTSVPESLENFAAPDNEANTTMAAVETTTDEMTRISVFGATGTGKSTFLTALSGLDAENEDFVIGGSAASVTTETVARKMNWLGNPTEGQFLGVDCPGLADTEGRDARHMAEMVKVLRGLGHLHLICVVFNGQMPRMDMPIIEMLKLLEQSFGSAVWGAVALVFTRWTADDFGDYPDAEKWKGEWNDKLRSTFPSIGEVLLDTQKLPCYFVDSITLVDPRYKEKKPDLYEKNLSEMRQIMVLARSKEHFLTAKMESALKPQIDGYKGQTRWVKGHPVEALAPVLQPGRLIEKFTISPGLPAMVSMDTKTGLISGIPAHPMAPTFFTVTGEGPAGSCTFDIRIECVVPDAENIAVMQRGQAAILALAVQVPADATPEEANNAEMEAFNSTAASLEPLLGRPAPAIESDLRIFVGDQWIRIVAAQARVGQIQAEQLTVRQERQVLMELVNQAEEKIYGPEDSFTRGELELDLEKAAAGLRTQRNQIRQLSQELAFAQLHRAAATGQSVAGDSRSMEVGAEEELAVIERELALVKLLDTVLEGGIPPLRVAITEAQASGVQKMSLARAQTYLGQLVAEAQAKALQRQKEEEEKRRAEEEERRRIEEEAKRQAIEEARRRAEEEAKAIAEEAARLRAIEEAERRAEEERRRLAEEEERKQEEKRKKEAELERLRNEKPEVTLLSKVSSDYARIRKLVEDSYESGNGRCICVEGISSVHSANHKMLFEEYRNVLKGSRSIRTLFHGTSSDSASGIINGGFVIPTEQDNEGQYIAYSDTMFEGSDREENTLLFGAGIYLAGKATKAAFFADYAGVLLVCHVLLGRVMRSKVPDSTLDAASMARRGYDSIFCPGGDNDSVVASDEYVVYDSNAIYITHAVDVYGVPFNTVELLLQSGSSGGGCARGSDSGSEYGNENNCSDTDELSYNVDIGLSLEKSTYVGAKRTQGASLESLADMCRDEPHRADSLMGLSLRRKAEAFLEQTESEFLTWHCLRLIANFCLGSSARQNHMKHAEKEITNCLSCENEAVVQKAAFAICNLYSASDPEGSKAYQIARKFANAMETSSEPMTKLYLIAALRNLVSTPEVAHLVSSLPADVYRLLPRYAVRKAMWTEWFGRCLMAAFEIDGTGCATRLNNAGFTDVIADLIEHRRDEIVDLPVNIGEAAHIIIKTCYLYVSGLWPTQTTSSTAALKRLLSPGGVPDFYVSCIQRRPTTYMASACAGMLYHMGNKQDHCRPQYVASMQALLPRCKALLNLSSGGFRPYLAGALVNCGFSERTLQNSGLSSAFLKELGKDLSFSTRAIKKTGLSDD